MNSDWKFFEEPNTACLTTQFVLDGSPILRVYHDYDGDWQFHGPSHQPAVIAFAKWVCLADMLRRDKSLNELHDLPLGWRAERSTSNSKWERFKDSPFPSFIENGYYLENALWLSQSWPDINPPDRATWEDLSVGDHVKLVFRFADEESEREDDQCERMWVLITGRDEDGNFFGTIDNDPNHESAKYGDEIWFHPLNIVEIYMG